MKIKSSKGQIGNNLWMLIGITLLLIIVVPLLMEVYAKNRDTTRDCKGSCIVGTCVGFTVSGDCYKNGKKQDGICCITEGDLINGSNTSTGGGGSGNSSPAAQEPDDCATYRPVIEIRRGLNTVEPVRGLISLVGGEQSEYSIYTERADGKTCAYTCKITLLLDSKDTLTDRITLNPAISDTTCTVSAKATTKISGTYVEMPQGGWPGEIDQNKDYKIIVESKYGEKTVASAILRVEVKPPLTITT